MSANNGSESDRIAAILHRIACSLERIVNLAEEERAKMHEEWTPTDYDNTEEKT